MPWEQASTTGYILPQEVEWPCQVSWHQLPVSAKVKWKSWPAALTTTYKKLHAAKAVSHMCSTDPVVRSIATEETKKESESQWLAFHPFTEVIEVLKEEPGITKREDKSGKEPASPIVQASLPECTQLSGESSQGTVQHSPDTFKGNF